MSHQVQIDYQGVAIQCQSVCEVAEKRLQELDEMLEKARRHDRKNRKQFFYFTK